MNTTLLDTYNKAMEAVTAKTNIKIDTIALNHGNGPFKRMIFSTSNGITFAEMEIYELDHAPIYRVSIYNMITILTKTSKELEPAPLPPENKVYDAVMAYAIKNYDNGWDTLVECYSREEVISAMEDATTTKQALQNVDENLGIKLYDEVRKDIQATAF